MMFTKRCFSAFVVFFGAAFFAGQVDAQSNVLVIIADDMGVDQLASYGEGVDPAITPNIDALAQSGVLFRNAYSCPSCSPTRATIMTGRYGFRTGIGFIINADSTSSYALPASEVTLPEMLDIGTSGAWTHGFIGKWHLGNHTVGGDSAPNLAGWSHFAGTPTNLRGGDTYFDWRRVTNGVSEQVTEYATVSSVTSALDFINQSSSTWLCLLSFHTPHSPWHEPPANLHSVDLVGKDPLADAHEFYKAMVQAMDAEMGRLFATMDPVELANTLVIFVGDNGTPGPPAIPPFDPSRSKGTTFEGGINVPMIVSGPQITSPGRESSALVHTVDIFATIADEAGVDLAANFPGRVFDGESFLPVLADANAVFPRDYAYSERFAPNAAIGPVTIPICPPPGTVVCQDDLGFEGPGTVQLSMCGDELYGGTFIPLSITGARPNSIAYLVRSAVSSPVPIFGGTLAAFPPTHIIPGATNANGEITLVYFAGTEPSVSYLQVGVLDDTYPQGVAFSNCVFAETLSTHIRVIRDTRYKLVYNASNCQEQFYDLLADPFESAELLSLGALSSSALSHYRSLHATLAQL